LLHSRLDPQGRTWCHALPESSLSCRFWRPKAYLNPRPCGRGRRTAPQIPMPMAAAVGGWSSCRRGISSRVSVSFSSKSFAPRPSWLRYLRRIPAPFQRHLIRRRRLACPTSDRFACIREDETTSGRDQAGPGSARTSSLKRSHSVAVQISVWAWPNVRMSADTRAAVSISLAMKMSR